MEAPDRLLLWRLQIGSFCGDSHSLPQSRRGSRSDPFVVAADRLLLWMLQIGSFCGSSCCGADLDPKAADLELPQILSGVCIAYVFTFCIARVKSRLARIRSDIITSQSLVVRVHTTCMRISCNIDRICAPASLRQCLTPQLSLTRSLPLTQMIKCAFVNHTCM